MVRLDSVKPGDSFSIGFEFIYLGYPEDLTTWTVDAYLRGRNGAKVCTLTYSMIAQTGDAFGWFDLSAADGDTALATIGDNFIDIRFRKGTFRKTSATFILPFDGSITNDNV